ncbi:hypothetical protein CLV46_0490 [Diaminobutyricimonas aerilata]|uniref:VOC domain-containing protein n=1 Tax=Diaminobutyricimonas aerilata TaxID=1162967 RepID=A0A2M9CGE9_9MICO|nr:VOC family protein [Diaminobutyricimonas aerilata]PJJ70958.1 hypothetical protein CLV46_0490 [Diaminobutyricimonas aerilata]
MNDFFDAAAISPVPAPSLDAVAPEVYRGIYGMPMFATIPSSDLDASARFWTHGLGFVELFAVPGRLVHLRRWAFQDVLLVPGESDERAPAMTVSFSSVLGQLDAVAAACNRLRPGSATPPRETPWNSTEVEVVTPENARVIMTAARPLVPDSDSARYIEKLGLEVPHS